MLSLDSNADQVLCGFLVFQGDFYFVDAVDMQRVQQGDPAGLTLAQPDGARRLICALFSLAGV